MNKQEFEEKCRHAAEARETKSLVAHNNYLKEQEANRITQPDSPYRPFEVEFGAERLKEVNEFFYHLDIAEFESFIDDPMLALCQKFLDWKIEVGEDRLWHEFNIRYDGGEHAENEEGSLFVIKKAWEQVKKEQEIIANARKAYSTRINEIRDANPKKYSDDIGAWIALCEGFSKLEALQEFSYPLPFDTIFGKYTPKPFYYGKQQNKGKFFGAEGE